MKKTQKIKTATLR